VTPRYPGPVQTIPSLDVNAPKARFDRELSLAFREVGFVKLRGHAIDAGVTEPAYAALQAFFAFSPEQKRRYHVPASGGARGYTPFRVEKAKDASAPDLKEFFHVGRELAKADDRWATPENLWPKEVPGFRPAMLTLFRELERTGAWVLEAVARDLALPTNWFADKIDHGSSILRPLCYPPLDPGAPVGVRSAAHEDINLITLLIASGEPGLQVLSREGNFIDVEVASDEIVVNIGDMLQRLTNHALVSTTHRVVNPLGSLRDKPRYSIPFFLHPNPEFVIESLPSCVSEERPNRYPEPITAQAYLEQRLREIGLL